MTSVKYYGVHIPRDNVTTDQADSSKLNVYTSYEEAFKVIKEFKIARFKCFASEEEAIYFSLNGSASGSGNPNVVSESIPFKSLKRPEIYKFRRCIETQNLEAVKTLVWDNPRYLIGIGDTPTIMQEGPRYNALHIAAMYNSSKEAEFILKTVSSKFFTQLLYGAVGDSSYLVRPEVMTDMYLNTPDKALNETPLHFAAKYGSLDIIRIFVQYPQLQMKLKNKHGQTPKDIICQSFRSKVSTKVNHAKDITLYCREIHKLLDEPFFVPIWRSNEDEVQPIIGKPFSPKSPPVCPLLTSPLSPVMEIKAVAGPMSFDEALDFHKTWKSPIKKMNSATPITSKSVPLRSPLCCEKRFEQVGRTLAKQFHISWKEYWPFIDTFTDLASEEGLNLLERYLQNVIVRSSREMEKNRLIINSPISDLCNAFSKISISSPASTISSIMVSHPNDTTLYLCVDNLCLTFANSVVDSFRKCYKIGAHVNENVIILLKKIRNFSASIRIFRDDAAFTNFPFYKIHARVAFWIVSGVSKVEDGWLPYVTSIFKVIHRTEYAEITQCVSISPSSSVDLDEIVRTLKCISENVMDAVKTEILSYDESEIKGWCLMSGCVCFDTNNNVHRNKFDRNVSCMNINTLPSRKSRYINSGARKKIDFIRVDEFSTDEDQQSEETYEVTDIDLNCDNSVKLILNGTKSLDDESGDEFFTPPSSSYDSTEEVESPEEGPNLFIYDNRGTSMDNIVLEALGDLYIDPDQYPSIYRWRHSVLLNNKRNRCRNWVAHIVQDQAR